MANNLFNYDEDEQKKAQDIQNIFGTPVSKHDTTMPINRQHEAQPQQQPRLQDEIAARLEALRKLQQGE